MSETNKSAPSGRGEDDRALIDKTLALLADMGAEIEDRMDCSGGEEEDCLRCCLDGKLAEAEAVLGSLRSRFAEPVQAAPSEDIVLAILQEYKDSQRIACQGLGLPWDPTPYDKAIAALASERAKVRLLEADAEAYRYVDGSRPAPDAAALREAGLNLDEVLAWTFWTSDNGKDRRKGNPSDLEDSDPKLGKAWADLRALLRSEPRGEGN